MQHVPAQLIRARALTILCAQHLCLIGFRSGSDKPILGPAISTYHDMLDPDASDERRLAACRRYQGPIARHAELEELQGDLSSPRPPDWADPYRLASHTTLRGALLRYIEADLAEAVLNFKAAGVHDVPGPAQDGGVVVF